MKMIPLIAAVSVAFCATACAGERPIWTAVGTKDGMTVFANLNSIERKAKGNVNLPTSAHMLIYRNDGTDKIDGFHIVGFNCRGRFVVWDHPDDLITIEPGSLASKLEDIACWGPTR